MVAKAKREGETKTLTVHGVTVYQGHPVGHMLAPSHLTCQRC